MADKADHSPDSPQPAQPQPPVPQNPPQQEGASQPISLPPPPSESSKDLSKNPSKDSSKKKAEEKPKINKNRVPLPLLSRAKLRPPRDIPIAAGGTAPEAAPVRLPRKRSLVWAIIGRLLAYGSLVGLGVGAVHVLRETQVQGLISAPAFTLPQEVYLIHDFSDDIRTLKSEYKMSNEPFERDLRTKEEALHQVQGDLAGLDKRKELITEDAANAENEIKAILDAAHADSKQLWDREGAALDAEYEQKLTAFQQALLDRAKQTGVTLELEPTVRSPEIWVNSYRLALYNPPAKLKAVPEREWIEKQLADWHDYEKTVDSRRKDLQAKADDVRKGVSPKVDAVQARIKSDNADLADIDSTAQPLNTEKESLQVEADAARERAQAQRTTFATQLLDIPNRNIIEKFPVTTQGRFQWENLNQDTKYPPGSYLLWASIKKGDQQYWALVPFTVTEYSRLDLVLTAKAFVPAMDLLK